MLIQKQEKKETFENASYLNKPLKNKPADRLNENVSTKKDRVMERIHIIDTTVIHKRIKEK